MSSHSFPAISQRLSPSDSNAWASCLSCGSGGSTTNHSTAFTSSVTLTGGLGRDPVLFGGYRPQPHSMGGGSRGTIWDLIQQGPSLLTGSPPLTTTSSTHNWRGFVGYFPSSLRRYRSSILARPWGVANTLQGETWPFLYPTQGMCPPDATTFKPGSHPSRYRGPRYH